MIISTFKKALADQAHDTMIMGILNVTPDSFSDGGKYATVDSAVNQALEMEAQGADIIDIGGESTRPGSDPVSQDEELQRVIPVIEALRRKSTITISIDTYKSAVAEQALKAGADLINDISGFRFDLDMVDLAIETGVPVIIMHIKGTPRNMQKNPRYDDVIKEIRTYFRERLRFAQGAGLANEQIILDPGIGFGKRLEDNFVLLNHLDKLVKLGFPVLVGPSRKSFIGNVLKAPVNGRLEGTAAAVTASILQGARIVRVHDVAAMKKVAVVSDYIRRGGQA